MAAVSLFWDINMAAATSYKNALFACGRRVGLMVSALDFGSDGSSSSSGRGTALCSWARYLTLTVPLFTQVYKWVPANLMLVGNPVMD